MRHKVYGKHLGRDKNQRDALFKNLVGYLILHGSIKTTEAKAKAIKGLVDKIINQAKDKSTKRLVTSFLTQKEVQEKLFKEIVHALGGRDSGYTSLVKLGPRVGDGAMMVRMSLLMEEREEKGAKNKVTQKTSTKFSEKKVKNGRSDRKTKPIVKNRRGSSR